MKRIIELKSIYDWADAGEEKSIYSSIIGFFSSYEKATEQMNNMSHDGCVMFLTYEYDIDKINSEPTDNSENWICTRQYKVINGKITLTHSTYSTWCGHTEDEYSYHTGDIIEYVGIEDTIWKGIVCHPPISIDEVKERGLMIDEYDDSYMVYGLGEGDTHDHIMSYNVIGLANVTDEERKQYEEKLEERIKANTQH